MTTETIHAAVCDLISQRLSPPSVFKARQAVKGTPLDARLEKALSAIKDGFSQLDAMRDIAFDRNLLELEGTGHDIWEGIDPVEYIRELRS